MSTSLLYHGFGIVGYRYIRTKYREGTVIFTAGLFNIDTLEMIEGDLPNRAKKLVIEWATMNKDEMKKMWDTQEFHKLPPLE